MVPAFLELLSFPPGINPRTGSERLEFDESERHPKVSRDDLARREGNLGIAQEQQTGLGCPESLGEAAPFLSKDWAVPWEGEMGRVGNSLMDESIKIFPRRPKPSPPDLQGKGMVWFHRLAEVSLSQKKRRNPRGLDANTGVYWDGSGKTQGALDPN